MSRAISSCSSSVIVPLPSNSLLLLLYICHTRLRFYSWWSGTMLCRFMLPFFKRALAVKYRCRSSRCLRDRHCVGSVLSRITASESAVCGSAC
jgi:hypothetical protein